MRLLILTQKMDLNDPILGFFHRWVEEFARQCESVIVICLFEGAHALPNNVRVLSLGKEGGVSRLKYLKRFFSYIWRERKNYDAVYVHMNPVYAVLGGFLWRMWRKKIALWYVHGHVDVKLRTAVAIVHRVFTAVPASFPLSTPKLVCVGHGIDMNVFREKTDEKPAEKTLELLHVGRISAKKHILEVLGVARVLKQKGFSFKLTFVGEPGTPADEVFYGKAQTYVKENNLSEEVVFRGAIPNMAMPDVYRAADYLIHFSSTGGLDKVVIESWCVGTPAFTNQKGFEEYLGAHKDVFFLPNTDGVAVADAVVRHHGDMQRKDKEADVTRIMRSSFDVTVLAGKLVKNMEHLTKA